MKDRLIKIIAKSSDSSGVYQFLDINKKTLYVGKAKNLKKRLISYSKDKSLSTRIRKMISLAEDIQIIQTLTENEALLLECNLIKKLMPRYNILLRDGKTFPYIEISDDEFPRISKYRGKRNNQSNYFGPFANGFYVDKIINILKKSFLLRNCSNNEFKSRKKPCLEYQIKKCSAPCVKLVSKEQYQELIKDAIGFLSGKNQEIQDSLAKKMTNFSKNFDYEKAAIIRDRITAIANIQNKQNINIVKLEDSDVICLDRKNDLAIIYISFYRSGNNYGAKPYFIKINEDDSDSDIVTNFISQFYLNEIVPKNIILSDNIEDIDLIQGFLTNLSRNDSKINIFIPKKGYRFDLIQDYLKIANQELQHKINQNMNNKQRLIEIKNIFNLEKIPEIIEVYDNSHISGNFKVGAMICFGKDGFIKNNYRKFNIESNQIKDDTAMMKHVLMRRFKRLKNDKNSIKPDLIILDGGKGQLSAAKEVFHQLNIDNQDYIGISKGPKRNAGEEYFHQEDKESFTLKKDDPAMYFLQNLRDEAHRFAISFHRQKRQKSVTKSALEDIAGIGAARKKLLLNKFGSIEAIKNASISDLCRIKGVGKSLAKKMKLYQN